MTNSRYKAEYNNHEIPFIELVKYFESLGAKDTTRQPVPKIITFSASSKETVNKIKNLEWITKVTYICQVTNQKLYKTPLSH